MLGYYEKYVKPGQQILFNPKVLPKFLYGLRVLQNNKKVRDFMLVKIYTKRLLPAIKDKKSMDLLKVFVATKLAEFSVK